MRLSELLPANDLVDDTAALGRRYRSEGCLLIRQALARAQLTPLIDETSEVIERWGVGVRRDELRWTGLPAPAIDSTELNGIPAMLRLVEQLDRNDSPLQPVADRLCGKPMHLWRIAHLFVAIPDDAACATAPHQDHYGRDPTGDYRRFWIALTRIPFGDGGLGLALGSHHRGRLPVRELDGFVPRAEIHFPSQDDSVRGIPPALVDDHWHTAALEPGDLFVLHGDLVHRGLPATSDRIRIALAVTASASSDPRPTRAFTLVENHARRQRLIELVDPLGLAEDEIQRIESELARRGIAITEENVRAASAHRQSDASA